MLVDLHYMAIRDGTYIVPKLSVYFAYDNRINRYVCYIKYRHFIITLTRYYHRLINTHILTGRVLDHRNIHCNVESRNTYCKNLYCIYKHKYDQTQFMPDPYKIKETLFDGIRKSHYIISCNYDFGKKRQDNIIHDRVDYINRIRHVDYINRISHTDNVCNIVYDLNEESDNGTLI